MRRLLIITAIILAIGSMGRSYLSHGGTATLAATRPASVVELPQPSSFAQIHGHPGFWRLAEDQAGVWWFLSPEGKLEFLNTVTTVQPEQEPRDKDSAHFVSTDWDGKYQPADIDHWANATLMRVRDCGFKGLATGAIPRSTRSMSP